ncbi:hypothetical protein L7F22_059931 [Adiantum nelumboides]|nr:hypothetical protein [Adiantum nelumboides]
MGAKRCRNLANYKLSNNGEDDGGYSEQKCRAWENCEADRVRDEMYEEIRQHQRKRPRRATKPLVDLSEFERFCLVPSSTPVCYHLPCEVSNARRLIEDSLHLDLSQAGAASASLYSQACQYGLGNKQLRAHEDKHGFQGDHEGSSHEQKLMECKLKIMGARLNYGVDVWSLAAQLMFPTLVPTIATEPKLLSAHICEGPGGFIQAVRMLRSQGTKCKEGTKTESLLSKMQTSRIQEFMIKSDKGHVYYGADESGDVTNPVNISSFVQFVLKKTGGEKMHLITGDGAFDISDDFSLQEQSHAHLFFCEILLAVQLQCPGGAFVLKVFDCFTETTMALLYILTTLYTTVEIVRPRTSRVCNSERFVVAQGFRGLPKSLEDKLTSIGSAWFDSAKNGLSATLRVLRPYPPLFLEALNQGNAAVANEQSACILQAVVAAENLGERLSFTDSLHHKSIISILRRKVKTLDLQRTNALALCKTLDIPLANSIV